MSLLQSHLPVLLIIVPLVSATITVFIRHKYFAWLFCLITTITCFSLSILQVLSVDQGDFYHYQLGNWPAPWGIELAVDYLNAFVLLLVTGAGLICCIYSKESLQKEINNTQYHLFYTAYLLNVTGLTGVVLTGDAFNLFVFIEISAISSYALVALGKHRNALFSAYRYLIFGTIGATFILIGLGFLYVMTGTLNMQDLSVRLAESGYNNTAMTGMGFIIVGVCIKLALFPCHIWLPSVYQYSPSVITIFFSATTTKVFIYVLLRYLLTVLDSYQIAENILLNALYILSLIAIIYGSAKAIISEQVKSVFAYSSVAQIGYMVLAITILNEAAITAATIYMVNHAVIKAAIFMGFGCIAYRYNIEKISDLNGMFNLMPMTSIAILIACLGLIGIPTTAGFISKWYLLNAVVAQEDWLSLVVILSGSLFSLIYVWKIIEMMYLGKVLEESKAQYSDCLPLSMVLPLWLLVISIIYLGLDSSVIYEFSENIANYFAQR